MVLMFLVVAGDGWVFLRVWGGGGLWKFGGDMVWWRCVILELGSCWGSLWGLKVLEGVGCKV